MATKGGGNPTLFNVKKGVFHLTRDDREEIAEEYDGEREQRQKLQKSRKQQRKRRNEPKNAKQANEQS